MVELSDAAVDAIARRVVELLEAPTSAERLLTAAELAERLGVDRAWVYEHAAELGAIRLGGGERGRLRFGEAAVRDSLARSGSAPGQSPTTKPESMPRHRPPNGQGRRASQAQNAGLLPIRARTR